MLRDYNLEREEAESARRQHDEMKTTNINQSTLIASQSDEIAGLRADLEAMSARISTDATVALQQQVSNLLSQIVEMNRTVTTQVNMQIKPSPNNNNN